METTVPEPGKPWIGPVFIFLFFFNTFLLPEGATLTLLLTPVWLFLLWKKGALRQLSSVMAILFIYAVIHISSGVILHYYLISATMILCAGIFALSIAFLFRSPAIDIDAIFRKLVLLNFAFTLLSLAVFWVPLLKPMVWYSMSMSDQIKVVSRLKLFTSEASHYSYLLAPVAIYYYCKAMFSGIRSVWVEIVLISIPLAFSLSFGVLGCLLFTGAIVAMLNFRRVFDTREKRYLLFGVLALVPIITVFLWMVFPENILFVRIANIFHGRDTSFRARTYESFQLADRIAALKSRWWGIGPGQLKELGRATIIQFYYPYPDPPATLRIPNAAAETIVCFGYIGFALRISVQLVLLFRTRLYRNPQRLWLFLFLFFFQFMGSYITNPAEYFFWVLAFSKVLDTVSSDFTSAETRDHNSIKHAE